MTIHRTAALLALLPLSIPALADIGLGAPPPPDSQILVDGTRATLDNRWTYWQGPLYASSLPIKWRIVPDPVDPGTCLQAYDPVAEGGKYGTADIVTKQTYRDFRLHVEFLVPDPGGNSGVFLQNRFEIQIFDGDKTKHGMGAIINESDSPYAQYRGLNKWNAYDIMFRAARFNELGKRTEQPRLTMYFNGVKVHENFPIQKAWGAGSFEYNLDDGRGFTDTPQGLKLQNEGHPVLFRNTWIIPLNLGSASTDFEEPIVKH